MTASPCDPAVIGALAVLQSAFPAMTLPDGVVSLIEAGLGRVPGVRDVRLRIWLEPGVRDAGTAAPPPARRIWLETLSGRYGSLDLVVEGAAAFDAYDPYVRNLMNAVALHVENAHQQSRLEHALASLREADRRKDEFLGLLSHELRNPLAPIRSSIYLLERADPGSEQARRARAIIHRQTEHLARLVDDLLDVKRLSTGKLRLHSIRMDVVQHVREAVEDMRPLLGGRGLSLDVSAPTDPVWVHGDPTRIAQIVTNLVSNASKFTNFGGHVQVSVERRAAHADIRVSDDGVGVAPEVLPHLFEPFVQGENTIHRSGGGLGLGLSLVRGITELHGGTVTARSEGIGKGTEFRITLPVSQAPVVAAPVAAPSSPAASRRIVIVEDNRDAAESLRDVLDSVTGSPVRIARDGEQGVQAAKEISPDIVLCDLGLPVIDGYEVARRIRSAAGPERNCRLVALSGYAAPEDVERSLRAGFDYHLAKPPDLDELLKLVAEAPTAAPNLREAVMTGHHEVDAQHEAILEEAARVRHGSPATVWDSLRSLQHHTASHFQYEEALMEEVRYPRTALHQEQHVQFASEVARLRERIEQGGATPENLSTLADTVEGWVAEHVLEEDRRLAEFLRTGDDFAQGASAEPEAAANEEAARRTGAGA